MIDMWHFLMFPLTIDKKHTTMSKLREATSLNSKADAFSDLRDALDFKDAASPPFGHSNVVFDLLKETGIFCN